MHAYTRTPPPTTTMTTRVTNNNNNDQDTPSDLIDAPRNIEARNAQEQLWAETNVDARQQLHMREAALRYKGRFQLAMRWYNMVKSIINCTENSLFYCLHPGLIELVVSFAFPQHEGLVFPLHQHQQILYKHFNVNKELNLKNITTITNTPKTITEEDNNNSKKTTNGIFTKEQKEPEKKKNQSWKRMPFKIFVRPRPLLQFEKESDEYKVISTDEKLKHTNVIQLHDGRMDRKYMYMFNKINAFIKTGFISNNTYYYNIYI